MRHARPDYEHIQDSTGKIPADEPVFLVRGQDVCAPATLRAWADEAEKQGANQDIIDLVRSQAITMEEWQAENHSKIPDLPKEG